MRLRYRWGDSSDEIKKAIAPIPHLKDCLFIYIRRISVFLKLDKLVITVPLLAYKTMITHPYAKANTMSEAIAMYFQKSPCKYIELKIILQRQLFDITLFFNGKKPFVECLQFSGSRMKQRMLPNTQCWLQSKAIGEYDAPIWNITRRSWNTSEILTDQSTEIQSLFPQSRSLPWLSKTT